MLFMLPDGRVPLPEERQRFAVSIQPPWQLVAPDGQRYKLADIRFDLAAVHAWLARKPVQRTSTPTRRMDWNILLKNNGVKNPNHRMLPALLGWARPLYSGAKNPSPAELLKLHRWRCDQPNYQDAVTVTAGRFNYTFVAELARPALIPVRIAADGTFRGRHGNFRPVRTADCHTTLRSRASV